MHPAEVSMIESAIEQIENSCKALRRYIIMKKKSELQVAHPAHLQPADESRDNQLDDEISAMITKLSGGN